MKCPRCHHDNPVETLFCEECDHRTDQPYRRRVSIPPFYLVSASVVLGILAVVTFYLDMEWFISVATGGAGVFLGGYSMSIVRLSSIDGKTVLVILAGVAIAVSVVGFMLGIASYG